MSGLGFVRSELEIKTLTLHILDYIKASVTFDELLEMVFVDGAVNYFMFADYLNGMVTTGHVDLNSDSGVEKYTITKKGIRDLEHIRSSVPGSVLREAEKVADKIREQIIRRSLVDVKVVEDGDVFRAVCSLSDDHGEIFSFSMTAMSRESAKKLTSNFYSHAERIYNDFLRTMLDTSD